MPLKVIHTKNLRWVDIVNPDEADLTYLKDNFQFHPLDFEDVTTEAIRTKIDEYDSYHFIVLLFPLVAKKDGEIKPIEVDFFIGSDFLVTIHDGSMKTLVNLVHNVHQYQNVRSQYMAHNSGFLLTSILELLFKRSAPILDRMNNEIVTAEMKMFDLEIETLEHLSQLKKNIIVFRRVMKMHTYVLEKLLASKKLYLKFKDSDALINSIIEYEKNIWNLLTADKESVESFEETNQSLAGHKMNDILRTLTVFSVIIFILTLLINILLFVESISRIDSWPYLLPVTMVTLCVATLVMMAYFKKRRWL